MLELKNISASYENRNSQKVLDDINLTINSEKAVIIGPNGSGKTALIKTILGFTNILSGTITIDGKNIGRNDKILSMSSNLPELYRLMNLSVNDIFRLYSELEGYDFNGALNLISEFNLQDALDKKIYHLSAGQTKMICNILSIAKGANIILLDEPFDNIDQSRRIKLASILNDSNAEIVINTHEFDMVLRLKGWKLYFMIEGRVFGKFNVSQLDNLFISRGDVENSLLVINTSFGKFSIQEGSGDMQLLRARNLNSLLEELA